MEVYGQLETVKKRQRSLNGEKFFVKEREGLIKSLKLSGRLKKEY